MTLFQLAAVFLALVGTVGWLNAKAMRLPHGVAMLLIGLIGAAVLFVLRWVAPQVAAPVETILGGIDFPKAVLDYMLAPLLFAGAMQVDLGEMRRRRIQVLTLATLGVLASTAVVGFGLWGVARLLAVPLSLTWSLVFGALISPTDPIAVLATVRRGGLSKSLTAVLQGEALFNDGVGIVVFTAAVALAAGGAAVDPLGVAGLVLVQAVGGLALGLAAGWLVIRAMRAIDDYAVEVALTVALAAGVYAGAQALHLSGAIAVVAAGLLVGDDGFQAGASDGARPYVRAFWTLVDEMLNALLFLLLGLQLLSVPAQGRWAAVWLAAIALVLAARLVIVAPWGAYFHFQHEERGPSLVLTWGGLHGALSLALALSLPPSPARSLILSVTYAVVVFSVVVQGLTFEGLVRRLGRPGHP
jgi:CPA1 family monovalent cation:H+ antiporter